MGRVEVNRNIIGEIGAGLVVLVGFGAEDTRTLPEQNIWQTMLNKMIELRIFPDKEGKMNLSVLEFGGQILLVPQFTLYADTRRGRRPSFSGACQPDIASYLFDALITDVRSRMPLPEQGVQCGQFGADMDVSLTNWGPVTITLKDSDYCKG